MLTPNLRLINTAMEQWLLGTAQFGMSYGVTNTAGQTDVNEAWRMIDRALASGAIGLDTAAGYGSAEQLLASNKNIGMVTTKVSCGGLVSIRAQVEQSLKRMQCDHIDTLLIHDADNLYCKEGYLSEIGRVFDDLKKDGLISAAGVSVYEVTQTKTLLNHWLPDVVQIPLNPLNQSFVASGELRSLKSNGVRIQARSLFLQGVLLSDQLPDRLATMADIIGGWQQLLQTHKISAMSACKSFAISQQEVDHWVLGFENEAQLEHFISEPAYELPDFDCSVADLDRVNPSKW